MVFRKLSFALSLCLIFSVCVTGCGRSSYRGDDGGVKYLKNNIHVQVHKRAEYRASYSNWTDPGKRHHIIPVNTLVTFGTFSRGFTIIPQTTGNPVYFEYDEDRTRMSPEQYISLITSPEPVKLDSLSDLDRKGIQEGKAYVGMTKDGVRIALGYPAVHRTPSLDSNNWIYWTGRVRTIAVQFDASGLVTAIR